MYFKILEKMIIVLVTFCLVGLRCHGSVSANPNRQDIHVFYGDLEQEKIYEECQQLDYEKYINDVALLEAALRLESKTLKGGIKGISNDAYIQSISIDLENRWVYVDLSEEYPNMNYGSYSEYLSFKSLAYTIGHYYEAKKVFLMIDHKPYESGHYYFKEGLSLEINIEEQINE